MPVLELLCSGVFCYTEFLKKSPHRAAVLIRERRLLTFLTTDGYDGNGIQLEKMRLNISDCFLASSNN